ncbi:hypothetical protein D210916BOD24_31220 [Alteromonas sp. D210916BOD_24]
MADVRLWVAASSAPNGNLGGRTGADNFCNTDANKPVVAGSTTRAFISVSAADEIQDMPTLYSIPTNEAIYRADGTTVMASNFAALLNTGTTPLTNNVGFATFVTTGSTDLGVLDYTCNGWTDGSGAGTATVGQSNSTDNLYLSFATSTCNLTVKLYCMTYTPLAASSAGTDITDW